MNKLILLLTVTLVKNKVWCAKKIECGYKQCAQTREGTLNVHLIAHSHMDAGWVKTYDQYYYGSKPTVSTANVQLIFHSVLSELLHDKRRKFTFSEVSYFWRWWKEQRPTTRATFRGLVQEGRVEFAGGGWVQADEATTDYLMLLDQYTWGLRKMNDTLGPCGKPKAAWQTDTYGHTREHASLLAQMGYDGLFIGRVDHKARESMLEEERMEFMWRGSDVLGKMSDIMVHTLFNLYNAPDGFCFDFLCNEEPIIDDPDSKMYNADKRVNDFITQIEQQAKYYDHDNIMVTMGGDFTYQSAANWFMNMDKLINHVNTHPANMSDINIFYSTPSCYLKALYLNGRRDKAIYTEKGDLLPYGSDSSTYWTGFYTSRPSLKYLTRKTHMFLQVAKQLTVIARMGDSYELHLLRHALGLVMHHDAITGTSQQHVANDFVKILSEAFDACTKKVSALLSYMTPTWGGSRRSKGNQQFTTCHQLNISQCTFAESQESLLLLVYNPQSVKTYHYIRIPAIALHYVIRNSFDEELEYQLVPLPPVVVNLPGRSANTNHELVFEAENVPPLGYASFFVTAVKDPLVSVVSTSLFIDEELEYQLVPLLPAIVNLPGRSANTNVTNHELVFEAENVPPLGYASFFVTAVKDPLVSVVSTSLFIDEELEYQLVPLLPAIVNLPGRSANTNVTNHELVFEAENVPPLGYASFFVTAVKDPLVCVCLLFIDEGLEYQLLSLLPAIVNLPGRSANTNVTNHELVFEAENVPPLGYASFFVTAVKDPLGDSDYAKENKLGPDPEVVTQISNEYLKVTINKDTGLLESVQHVGGLKVALTQNFYYYAQTRGSLQSGAYSFRPDQRPVPIAETATYKAVRGPLVKEIQQRFSNWAHQTIRLYRGEEYLELDWAIGPVPIGTDLGKEVVSIFRSNISNRGEFYTDSNARQMMKRSCWNESAGQGVKKPVASCYYPVTSHICIQSANTSTGMCVLTDRCQGGTSYNEGEIELMIHRRLLTDDGFGLDETLNEEEHGGGLVIRGQHRLFLGNHKQDVEDLSFSERVSHAANRWQWEPWLFTAAGDKVNRRKWQIMRNKRYSTLRVHGIPKHVRVLTLEPWKASSALLRLENTLEKNDKVTQKMELPDELAMPTHVTIELRKLFQHLRIKSVREATLGANQWLEEARQMDWSTRYVYTGGDDGILPEDIDYVEEDRPNHKDSGQSAPHPDDESDYEIRKSERRRQPIKHRRTLRYSKRKRSVNISENFLDNIFDFDEKDITTEAEYTETTEQTTESTNTSETLGATEATSTLKSFDTNREFLSELKTSDSLEEESRIWLNLESGKKSAAEYIEDRSDDGVTKSMYEMYYKKNKEVKLKKAVKNSALKKAPWHKSQKKKILAEKEESNAAKENNENINPTESFNFGIRNYESGEEGSAIEEDEMELARMRTRRLERGSDRRKKRASQYTAKLDEQPDFIVTLRPTQIRTFVIRFENRN